MKVLAFIGAAAILFTVGLFVASTNATKKPYCTTHPTFGLN